MINLLIAASLLATGILCGIKFSSVYLKRVAFFKSLCAFNCDYAAEMRFSRKNLNDIYKTKYQSKIFNELLEIRASMLKGNATAINPLGSILKGDEISEVDRYFSLLGTTDARTQLGYTETYGEIFSARAKSSAELDGKTAALCRKLGFIAGLIAFVIAV